MIIEWRQNYYNNHRRVDRSKREGRSGSFGLDQVSQSLYLLIRGVGRVWSGVLLPVEMWWLTRSPNLTWSRASFSEGFSESS